MPDAAVYPLSEHGRTGMAEQPWLLGERDQSWQDAALEEAGAC